MILGHFPCDFMWLIPCTCQASIQSPPHQSTPSQRVPHYDHIILCLLLHSTHHCLIISYAFICLFIVSLIPQKYKLHESKALLNLAQSCIPVPIACTCHNFQLHVQVIFKKYLFIFHPVSSLSEGTIICFAYCYTKRLGT